MAGGEPSPLWLRQAGPTGAAGDAAWGAAHGPPTGAGATPSKPSVIQQLSPKLASLASWAFNSSPSLSLGGSKDKDRDKDKDKDKDTPGFRRGVSFPPPLVLGRGTSGGASPAAGVGAAGSAGVGAGGFPGPSPGSRIRVLEDGAHTVSPGGRYPARDGVGVVTVANVLPQSAGAASGGGGGGGGGGSGAPHTRRSLGAARSLSAAVMMAQQGSGGAGGSGGGVPPLAPPLPPAARGTPPQLLRAGSVPTLSPADATPSRSPLARAGLPPTVASAPAASWYRRGAGGGNSGRSSPSPSGRGPAVEPAAVATTQRPVSWVKSPAQGTPRPDSAGGTWLRVCVRACVRVWSRSRTYECAPAQLAPCAVRARACLGTVESDRLFRVWGRILRVHALRVRVCWMGGGGVGGGEEGCEGAGCWPAGRRPPALPRPVPRTPAC
jgi:hypothetical protein